MMLHSFRQQSCRLPGKWMPAANTCAERGWRPHLSQRSLTAKRSRIAMVSATASLAQHQLKELLLVVKSFWHVNPSSGVPHVQILSVPVAWFRCQASAWHLF